MSRQSQRRYGQYKETAVTKQGAFDRYVTQSIQIGGNPFEIPPMILKRWGLGEGDIWHYVEVMYTFRDNPHPVCDYEGYCVADGIFYDADLGYPPFNVCEACLCLKLMKDLSE